MSKLIVYEDNIGQTVEDQIKIAGKPFEIPSSATVSFKMRYANSSGVKVDESAYIVNRIKGQISYTWQSGDLDEPGEYYAWWSVEATGFKFEVTEFPVIVSKHSPGLSVETGQIYNIAKSYIPSTWAALEKSEFYSDALLQDRVEYVKKNILPTPVAVAQEKDLDIRVIHFLAKNVAVKVIPAGIDYWLDQKVSVRIETAAASQEIYDYEDRAKALMDLYQKLLKEIAEEERDIMDLLDTPLTRRENSVASYAEGQDEGFVTPSPVLNFRPYHFPPSRWDRW